MQDIVEESAMAHLLGEDEDAEHSLDEVKSPRVKSS
jgi:hypothetical protein